MESYATSNNFELKKGGILEEIMMPPVGFGLQRGAASNEHFKSISSNAIKSIAGGSCRPEHLSHRPVSEVISDFE